MENAEEFSKAVRGAEVECDRPGRPTEAGFTAYYQATEFGELAVDATKLGVGSLDDILDAMVSVALEIDSNNLRHWEAALQVTSAKTPPHGPLDTLERHVKALVSKIRCSGRAVRSMGWGRGVE